MKKFLYILLLTFSASAAAAVTHIEDSLILKAIESQGFSFAELVLGQGRPLDNAELSRLTAYESIRSIIANDLDERAGEDPYLAVNMSKKHRLFDKAWLSSAKQMVEVERRARNQRRQWRVCK